jgi:hypothetical protein
MARTARGLVDGRGVLRVIDALADAIARRAQGQKHAAEDGG